MRKFNKRFCILTDTIFYYYKEENVSLTLHVQPLTPCRAQNQKDLSTYQAQRLLPKRATYSTLLQLSIRSVYSVPRVLLSKSGSKR